MKKWFNGIVDRFSKKPEIKTKIEIRFISKGAALSIARGNSNQWNSLKAGADALDEFVRLVLPSLLDDAMATGTYTTESLEWCYHKQMLESFRTAMKGQGFIVDFSESFSEMDSKPRLYMRLMGPDGY